MTTGSCLACGEPSTLRCSSCAGKKNGISLYFCSTERQKLIWPFHRLVCGERAHPFRAPAFAQEEADALVEHLAAPARDEMNRKLQQAMRAALGSGDAARKAQQLVGKDELLVPLAERSDPFSPNVGTVYKLRVLEWNWYHDERNPNRQVPFGQHLTFHYDMRTDGAPRIDFGSKWHSELCHRLAAPLPLQAAIKDIMNRHFPGQKAVSVDDLDAVPGALDLMTLSMKAETACSQFLREAQGTPYADFAAVVEAKRCDHANAFGGGMA